MIFTFIKELPKNYDGEINIISGVESLQYNGQEYLLLQNDNAIIAVFEIKYEYHCSPFKEADILDDILAVGFEDSFYLYHLGKKNTLLHLKVTGYFGHLYLHNKLFYVASARGIHCINGEGNTIWTNNNLAIDGVIINKFEDNKIYGSGELDPPGGWEDFTLDMFTGKRITSV